MNTILKFPFYVKASLILIGIYVFVSMLSVGQYIILPIIYATVIAILVSPVVDFLVKRKINRALSISIVLLTAALLFSGVIALLLSQAGKFGEALPQLTAKLHMLTARCVNSSAAYLNISEAQITGWLAHLKEEFINNSTSAIGITLATIGGLLGTASLTAVYIFMILFYRPHLVQFVHKLFGHDNRNNVSEILGETKGIIQSYLLGLLAETAIVAVMNTIGLFLLGIDYAILLGISGAVLNLIPYLGGIIGVFIFMMIALVTKPGIYVLYVFLLYTIIQLIDNNLIVPKIVGAKVKLNALVSIVAVIAGAALWGIPGMFISIPLTAIIKLLLDRIEALQPWGFLMGDTMPPIISIKFQGKAKPAAK